MFNRSLTEILLTIPGILIGLVFHEFAHALTADRLGDNTPRYQGRLTLSPLVHLDPIGLILIIVAGFGWAKPVQINPRNLKSPRRDDAIISLAGPLGNFVIAIIFAIILKITSSINILNNMEATTWGNLQLIIHYTVSINVVLGIFNLLPIPPLDGSHLLEDITNVERFEFYHIIRQYSTIILILIIATPIAGYIINPPVIFILNNLYGILGII